MAKISIDYSKMAQELVRILRGKYSQKYINIRLQETSNQVYRWEKGQAKIKWKDFCTLCSITQKDMSYLFNSYFRYSAPPDNGGEFLKFLFAGKSLGLVAKNVMISETKLRRMINGQSIITLEDFLKILFSMDKMETLALISELTGKKMPSTLAQEQTRVDKIIKEYFTNPFLGLILVCLELPGYKQLPIHKDSYLAEVTGMEQKTISRLLKLAYEHGIIVKEKGKYLAGKYQISDRGDRSDMLKVRAFWTNLALQKMKNITGKNAFGSIVFTTSNKAREQIIALYLRFFEDFKKIVEEDKTPHEIPLVMNFHLFNPGKDD